MLKDYCYDKVKLLHEMSRMLNFVKKHALPEAKRQKMPQSVKLYQELEKDLHKNIARLSKAVEELSKKGKFK